MKCLALDFGGSAVKYALVDNQARIEHSGKVHAPLDSTEEFVETVGALYDEFREQISGIAISMPGYIDPESGTLFDSGAYRALYGKNIFDLLRDRCPVPLAIENDGKCAALAESWAGALKGCKAGVVLIIGTALAGGLIKDGRIHSGKDFSAGELSYLITDPTQHGHLAFAYMSAGMLGMTYRICKMKNLDLAVQDSAPTLKWVDETVQMPYADANVPLKKLRADGVQFFQWLKEGDPDACAVYRIFINALAVVIHNVQVCYAPEKIVIGGGLSTESRIFDDVNRELEAFYGGGSLGYQLRTSIVKSKYCGECNLIGATCNFFQRIGQFNAKLSV